MGLTEKIIWTVGLIVALILDFFLLLALLPNLFGFIILSASALLTIYVIDNFWSETS